MHWQSLLGVCVGPDKGLFWFWLSNSFQNRCLTSESVEGTSLAFESVHHIHGSHRLPLGVLGVGDGIPDHILQEHLQHTTGLFVDQTRDSLHTTSASKTTDGWLGDTLDVITQNLPVTLGAPLSQSFSSLASSRHAWCLLWSVNWTNAQAKNSPSLIFASLLSHRASYSPTANHNTAFCAQSSITLKRGTSCLYTGSHSNFLSVDRNFLFSAQTGSWFHLLIW